MIKISLALITVLTLVQACNPAQEKNKTTLAEAKPERVAVIGITERHARVGMYRTNMTEKRRIAFNKLMEVTPYYTNSDGTVIFNKAETVPAYIGGADALNIFLDENLHYPRTDSSQSQEGTVFVDFIVDAGGAIRNAGVVDSTFGGEDSSFREEAIRVINSMPRWRAGRQDGENVNIQFSLPVTFLID